MKKSFVELRRKVEPKCFRPRWNICCGLLNFSGRVSAVVQNGRASKSGREKGFSGNAKPVDDGTWCGCRTLKEFKTAAPNR
jgi:hypothetical protein